MRQLTLFEHKIDNREYITQNFSAGGLCTEEARLALEEKYTPLLEVTEKFDRRSVSYQLSKKNPLHSWLKYKEGFSADLVNILLDEMKISAGDTIMDPFTGSGTTALVCQMRGINSIGCDIMPFARVAINAKSIVLRYDLAELETLIEEFSSLKMPETYSKRTPYVTITDSAYPEFNERFIQFATDWITASNYSDELKNLFTLCVLNSLERCSYTAKDGQYLRWDSRSCKVINANIEREKLGRKLLPACQCRDVIENIQAAVTEELNHVLTDIKFVRSNAAENFSAAFDFTEGSVLFELPKLKDNTLDGVITSPPYCNRYDYTRIYALELVYLGCDEDDVKNLRQALLSCTVENKSKLSILMRHYDQINAVDRFAYILGKVNSNAAFREVMAALEQRKNRGDLNNNGVLRMVEGYFTELAFVYAELYRICKHGATVAVVNDNVRYGGEIIPVDYLSTSFAEQFGFKPIKIYCLRQQKGNSSQQMKRFGRTALRKSITLWQK